MKTINTIVLTLLAVYAYQNLTASDVKRIENKVRNAYAALVK